MIAYYAVLTGLSAEFGKIHGVYSDFLIRTRQEAELLESGMALVEAASVEAASRRLDFEQSRDGSVTKSKKPANVPINFPTGSGFLIFIVPTLLRGNVAPGHSCVYRHTKHLCQFIVSTILRSRQMYTAGAAKTTFPRRSMGTIKRRSWKRCPAA